MHRASLLVALFVLTLGHPAEAQTRALGHPVAAQNDALCPAGTNAMLSGDHSEAIVAFSGCLGDKDWSPQDRAVLHEERAVAYWLNGRIEDAIADYGQVLQAAASPEAHIKRGLLHFTNRDYDRALADYGQALALEPRAPLAHITRALAFAWLNRGAEAKAAMDRGLELTQDEVLVDTVNEACWNFGLQGRPEIASPFCEQGTSANPRPIDHEALAFTLWQLGDLDRAQKELSTAYVVSLGNTAYEPEQRMQEFPLLLAQGLLTSHGYGPLPYGRSGPKTEEAIRAFQTDKGLAVDGQVSDDLIAALKKARPS